MGQVFGVVPFSYPYSDETWFPSSELISIFVETTEIPMIVLIIVAAILAMMGIVILIGKGDNLIAGFNTASQEERAKYDIKRLRGLIGGFLIALAPMSFLLLGEDTMKAVWSYVALTFVASIVVVVLANTWAKKKGK